MRERKCERHILLSVLTSISEHHSLVAGSLLFGVLANYTSIDIGALFVNGGDDSAGVRVELVVRLGVSYATDDFAYGFLNVYVGVV